MQYKFCIMVFSPFKNQAYFWISKLISHLILPLSQSLALLDYLPRAQTPNILPFFSQFNSSSFYRPKITLPLFLPFEILYGYYIILMPALPTKFISPNPLISFMAKTKCHSFQYGFMVKHFCEILIDPQVCPSLCSQVTCLVLSSWGLIKQFQLLGGRVLMFFI